LRGKLTKKKKRRGRREKDSQREGKGLFNCFFGKLTDAATFLVPLPLIPFLQNLPTPINIPKPFLFIFE
jgi:hypothetical protein